jgi:hypothetical protein
MAETTVGQPKFLRWVLGALLAAYLTGPALNVYFFRVNGSPLDLLANRLARSHYPPGAVPADINYYFGMAFDLWWIVSAAAMFVILCVLARFRFQRVALLRFAGVLAVGWFPLYWLCFPRILTGLPYFSHVVRLMLATELAVIIFSAHFYLSPKWPFSTRVSALLLVVHFGIWLWPLLPVGGFDRFSISWYHAWFWWRQRGLVYLLLGFCSSVVWGVYARRSNQNRHSADPEAFVT